MDTQNHLGASCVISSFGLTAVCGGQAWAVASGKINEFPNDKARWKTNFRCALNNLSVRFKMVQDNSKNSDDPHKIYEIVNTEREWEIQSAPHSLWLLKVCFGKTTEENQSVPVCLLRRLL